MRHGKVPSNVFIIKKLLELFWCELSSIVVVVTLELLANLILRQIIHLLEYLKYLIFDIHHKNPVFHEKTSIKGRNNRDPLFGKNFRGTVNITKDVV